MAPISLQRAAAPPLLMAAVVLGAAWKFASPEFPQRGVEDRTSAIARGDYLVHNVAMCVQCHSPRDEHGAIIVTQEFRGAPIPVMHPAWSSEWAARAPNIAGLPGFTDEQIVALLTRGQGTGRQPPMRPMPPFRMNEQDARAIIAYLRSLHPQ